LTRGLLWDSLKSCKKITTEPPAPGGVLSSQGIERGGLGGRGGRSGGDDQCGPQVPLRHSARGLEDGAIVKGERSEGLYTGGPARLVSHRLFAGGHA